MRWSNLLSGSTWSSQPITFSFVDGPSSGSPYYQPDPSNPGNTLAETLFADAPHFEELSNQLNGVVREFLLGGSAFGVSFSDVASVTFIEASSGGMIEIGAADIRSGISNGIAKFPGTSETSGDVWFDNVDNDISIFLEAGQLGRLVSLHELAHAVAGFVDIYQVWSPLDGDNSFRHTIMTNQAPTDLFYDSQTLLAPSGLQLYDIQALQSIYGANTSTRNELLDGDSNTTGTTYKLGQGLGRDGNANKAFMYTIWDGGGTTDTIDASGFMGYRARIDLRAGEFSSIGGNGKGEQGYHEVLGVVLRDIKNVSIVPGLNGAETIENAIGGNVADDITGNSLANGITGGYGNDIMRGLGGADTYHFAAFDGDDIIEDSGLENIISFTRMAFGKVAIERGDLPGPLYSDDLIIHYGTNGYNSSITARQHFDATNGKTVGKIQFLGETNTVIREVNLDLIDTADLDGAPIDVSQIFTIPAGTSGTFFGSADENIADYIYGNAANNSLSGRYGNDFLRGGAGDDTYNWAAGHGNDHIRDASGANDILRFGLGITEEMVSRSGDVVTVNLGEFGATITAEGVETLSGMSYTGITYTGVFSNSTTTILAGTPVEYFDGNNQPYTVYEDQADTINGGIENDRIYGNLFNDTLSGGAGHDVIDGGDGVDTIYGNSGNDILTGDGSDSLLDGGEGDDWLQNGKVMDGGADNDYITADVSYSITANGGLGSDKFVIEADSSTISGGDGQDSFHVFGNANTIYGNSASQGAVEADSYFVTGLGNQIIAGTGNDVIVSSNSGSTNNSEANYIDSGDGADVMYLSGLNRVKVAGSGGDIIYNKSGTVILEIDGVTSTSAVTLSIIPNTPEATLSFTGGSVRLAGYASNPQNWLLLIGTSATAPLEDAPTTYTQSVTENVVVYAQNLTLASITTLSGSDTIYGGSVGSTINAGAGQDVVHAGDGNDTVYGGQGIDELHGGAGNDIINGDTGDDFIEGDDGNDTLIGGDGDDTVYDGTFGVSGFSDKDTLIGGLGNDILTSYSGDDFLEGGDGDDTITALGDDVDITGGDGSDTINSNGVNADISGGLGNDIIVGSGEIHGDDGNDSIEGYGLLFGDTGNDTLIGEGTLDGGAGDDTINSYEYTEYVVGTDVLIGGGGTDVIVAEKSATIYGDTVSDVANGDGHDTITGSIFADIIIAGSNSTISARAGDDIITAAANSTIEGGEGNDGISLVGSGTSRVVVLSGHDIIGFAGSLERAVVDFGSAVSSGSLTYSYIENSSDVTAAVASVSARLQGFVSDTSRWEIAFGGSASAFSIADTYTNISTSFGGNATIAAIAGSTADIIITGGGHDVITSYGGNDTITTNSGNDTIYGGDGNDEIYSGSDNDTVYGGADTDLIYGNDGDDTIDGGQGDDGLSGEGGNDTLISLAGNDVAYGGYGNDDLQIGSSVQLSDITFDRLTTLVVGGQQLSDLLQLKIADGRTIHIASQYTSENGALTQRTETLKYGNNLSLDLAALFIARNDTFASFSAQALTGNILHNNGNGADVGGLLSVTPASITTSNGGAVTLGADGAFSYTSASGYVGFDSFTYTVVNEFNVSLTATAQFFTANDSANTLAGTATKDIIFGYAGQDYITAGAGNDVVEAGNNNDTVYGDAGNDLLKGGSGFDYIYGGDDADTIHGDDGNDSLRGAYGNDTIYGGIGLDSLTGDYGSDILFGGDERDTLRGGNDNDVLHGEAGDDLLYGDAGDDILHGGDSDLVDDGTNQGLWGGAGNDTIYGGAGYDYVRGNSGRDTVHAGGADDYVNGDSGDDVINGDAGNDTLYGGTGDDIINGGDGNDSIRGEEGEDILDGGAGNDDVRGGTDDNIVRGGDGNDVVYGGSSSTSDTFVGNDELYGDAGNDELYSGQGDDVLDGGTGDDILKGFEGSDTYVASAGADYIYDSAGTLDKLVFGATIDASDLIFTNGSRDQTDANDLVIGWNGGVDSVEIENQNSSSSSLHLERLLFADGYALTLSRYTSWMKGTSAGSTHNGSAADNTILGFAGNDTLNGNDGHDELHGGDGTDTVNGGNGNDLLHGGRDNDTVSGGDGNDTLYGGAGDDSLAGGTGHDIYVVTAGTDTITESDGADVLTFAPTVTAEQLTFANTGTEDVTITVASGVTAIVQNQRGTATGRVDTIAFSDGLSLNFGDYAQWLFASSAGGGLSGDNNNASGINTADTIIGGIGADTLRGYDLSDTLYGGAGNDIVYGGNDNDVVHGGSGDDLVKGDAGADTVYGGDGDDTLYGETFTTDTTGGDDVIYGGQGHDAIYGGVGLDTLYGEDGNDTIKGLSDNDTIYGGKGNDNLDGGDGNDTLLGDDGEDTITGGAGNDTAYGGFGADTINGNDGDDTLDGGSGDDVINGGNGMDTVHGGNGNDTINGNSTTATSHDIDILYGNDGDDIIKGHNGDDFIYGGAGADIMQGDLGFDTLEGGADGDTFMFLAASAFADIDLIKDFVANDNQGAAEDILDIHDLLIGYGTSSVITDFLMLADSGSDTLMSIDRDGTGTAHTWAQVARLEGVTALDENTLMTQGNLVA